MIRCIIIILVIYMRGILPRVRYDGLIYICREIILLLVLRYLFIASRVKLFIGLT